MNEESSAPAASLWELLEAVPDAMVVTSKDGRIRRVNEQTVGLFGYSRDELIGQPIEVLLPERFRDAHAGHRSGYASQPVRRPMGTGRELFGRRKDGSEFPAEISLAPTQLADSVFVTAGVRDITERKQAEELIRASEARYHRVLDNMLEAAQILGFDWRYLYLNDAAVRNARQVKEEMLGKTVMERFPGIETTEMFAALRRCMEERTTSQAEFAFTYPDGSSAWFEFSIQPVPEGLFILSLDITARKRVELEIRARNVDLEKRVQARTAQLEAANQFLARAKNTAEAASQELEAFSYSVAHDLRAPLRGMSGFAQLLVDSYGDKLDAEGQDWLAEILLNARKMSTLIDALLSLSHVTRSPLHREWVDLSTIVKDSASRLSAAEPERSVEIVVQDGCRAELDPALARVLVDNLLENAWKFTRKVPAARIELGAAEKDGVRAFYVRDNGAGFDMAFASKLFAPFQRLHGTDEFPGTGIGLATAKRIVQSHGGRIWAEGKVDGGATFYFSVVGRNEPSIHIVPTVGP